MPGSARSEIMDPTKIETHHVWSRCVQSMWLLGKDRYTGVDHSHRRHWFDALVEYLASVFAVDVGGPSLLSNHFHDVLRSRPDVAKRWTDEEVAWRWKLAWPQYKRGVWHRTVTDEQIESLLQRNRVEEGYLDDVRIRLSSISWYCGRLKESISRLCNFESEKKGHCWESRFHNRRLGSPEEVVGAVLYKDLQHAKAGIVDHVEDSEYCAIKRHFTAEAAAAFRAVHRRSPNEHSESDLCELEQLEALYANSYLAPLSSADLPLLTMPDVNPPPEELLYPARPSAPNALRGFVVNTRRRAEQAGAVLTVPAKLPAAASNEPRGGDGKSAGGKRARPGRQKSSCKIHRRLQRRRRRRASRHPLLGIPKSEYFELVKRAAAGIVASRQDCLREQASPPLPNDAVQHEAGLGKSESSSRHFHGRIQSWLREHVTSRLPDRLARFLLPTPRGDPPGN